MRYLSTLPAGTQFRLHEMHEVTATLVRVNDCRAVVRLDRPEREVEFIDRDGEMRQFRSRGSRLTSWAPTTVVDVLDFQNLKETAMTKTTTKKGKSTKSEATTAKVPKGDSVPKGEPPPKAEKAPKTQKPAKGDGQLSAIDAAAKVLAEKGGAMTTREMVEQMAAQGYWISPGGQTPAATLYSAILREITTKGQEARFRKTERGKFALTKA